MFALGPGPRADTAALLALAAMSAGRGSMWVIAGAITLAIVAVVAAKGVSAIPFGATGIIGAAILACVAFGLGYAE